MLELFKRKPVAIIAALIAAFCWGCSYPVVKVTYAVFSVTKADVSIKLLLVGLRFFMAGVFIQGFQFLAKIPRVKPNPRDWRLATLLGLLGVTVQYSIFYIGIGNTTASKSAIIQSSAIFMMVIISTLILRTEKLRLIHVISLTLGFAGVVVANLGGDINLDFRWAGEGLLLGSSLMVALTSILVKQHHSQTGPFFFASWQMILGSIPLLVLSIFTRPALGFKPYGFFLILCGALLSCISYALWYSIISVQSVVEMSFYRLFIPVFGIILSAVLLGETLTLQIVLALILVLSGAFILQYWQARKQKT